MNQRKSPFAHRRGMRRGQLGFTLVELLIALGISGIILVASGVMLRQLVVSSVDNTNRALANLQVHYVSSWISEDVVQAGNITLVGNSTTGNFPLVIYWEEPVITWVAYDVEPMKDKLGNDLWRLNRTKIDPYDPEGATSMVGEYLIPESTSVCKLRDKTDAEGNITQVNVLRLQVGALVDDREASALYEINPRANAGNITWVVNEDQLCP